MTNHTGRKAMTSTETYLYAVCVIVDDSSEEGGAIEIIRATSGVDALLKHSMMDDDSKEQVRQLVAEGETNVFKIAGFLNKIERVMITSFDPDRWTRRSDSEGAAPSSIEEWKAEHLPNATREAEMHRAVENGTAGELIAKRVLEAAVAAPVDNEQRSRLQSAMIKLDQG